MEIYGDKDCVRDRYIERDVTDTVHGVRDKTVDRSTKRQEESQKGARDWR